MNKGNIIILSGPSGSGKTTLLKKLLSDRSVKAGLRKSISATTREKRPGEVNGGDYFFLSPRQFEHKKNAGQFLEWKKVFGNYYGTPKRYVESVLNSGKHVLLCIDVKGAKDVCRQYPQAVKIFIKPRSLAVLKERLKKRESETKKSLSLRTQVAKKELAESKNYQHVIVNDQLSKSARRLRSIIYKKIIER